MTLANLQTLFLDGDGVLWHAGKPAPHLVEFFEVIRSRGISWALLSNNASLSVSDFVAKFKGFGVDANPRNIVNSTGVTMGYLQNTYSSGSLIYAVGHQSMKDTISDSGFEIVNGTAGLGNVSAVVVGIDREFNYDKLAVASRLIRGGAEFIATNTDSTYPTAYGLEPGAGSIVAAISTASGRQPVVMGKPQSTMFNVALRQVEAKLETTWMVGDRLETDILGAQSVGLKTILVLSGVATRDDALQSATLPDLIVDDIGALANTLRES